MVVVMSVVLSEEAEPLLLTGTDKLSDEVRVVVIGTVSVSVISVVEPTELVPEPVRLLDE